MGRQCGGAFTVPVLEAVLVSLVPLLEGHAGEACVGVHLAILVSDCGLVDNIVSQGKGCMNLFHLTF